MNGEKYLSEMEHLFLALADKTRLRLLNLMREDEICVCFFTEVLGESQPKISRHLAYLRSAGLVSGRREGKWINYKIVFPKSSFAAELLDQTLRWLKSQDEMREEHRKLVLICRAVEISTTTFRAPTPKTFVKTNMSRNSMREMEIFLL